jgi:hypothetical protein
MSAKLRITFGLLLCLASGFGSATLSAAPDPAETSVQTLASTLNSSIPTTTKSPVDQFRALLGMDAAGREQFLAGKPEADRDKLRQKIMEYEAMKPEEREVTLRMTQLRWYLLRFMPTPNTNRPAQLASVPDPWDSELVRARLETWDLLPRQLQQEVLTNETALRYFVGSSSPPNIDPRVPPSERKDLIEKVDQLNALPADQRERMVNRFRTFFELTAAEKQQTLEVLPAVQRGQMESALREFDRLPAAERRQCLNSFDDFANLSGPQRTQFLQNADHWRQMSESDRRVWQELVSHIIPESPPLPWGMLPPMPLGFDSKSRLRTN